MQMWCNKHCTPYSTVPLWLHSEHQFMHRFYKRVTIIHLRWGQPSFWIYFQNNSFFPKKHLGYTVRTNILAPTSSVFPLSTCPISALSPPFCYILFPSSVQLGVVPLQLHLRLSHDSDTASEYSIICQLYILKQVLLAGILLKVAL